MAQISQLPRASEVIKLVVPILGAYYVPLRLEVDRVETGLFILSLSCVLAYFFKDALRTSTVNSAHLIVILILRSRNSSSNGVFPDDQDVRRGPSRLRCISDYRHSTTSNLPALALWMRCSVLPSTSFYDTSAFVELLSIPLVTLIAPCISFIHIQLGSRAILFFALYIHTQFILKSPIINAPTQPIHPSYTQQTTGHIIRKRDRRRDGKTHGFVIRIPATQRRTSFSDIGSGPHDAQRVDFVRRFVIRYLTHTQP